MFNRIGVCIAVVVSTLLSTGAVNAEPSHGIAMHGQAALPADYAHFSYVDPAAVRSGNVVYGVRGTFDSLNPFLLKSIRTTARGVIDPQFGNLVYETLLQRSRDEPFTMYGLLAETIETDPDRTWAEFTIDADARMVGRRCGDAGRRHLHL